MSHSATPPSPDGLPIMGHGLAFTRNPTQAMESWAAHGDIVHLRFLGESWYLVTGPELIESILVDEQDRFTIAAEQQATFEGLEDHAMTTATGDRWKRLRRAAHPSFTRGRVESDGDRVAAVTARFVDAWPDGGVVDVQREMQRLTVQVLCETLLDEDVRGREDVVIDAADAFIDRSDFRRPGQLLPDWVPTPTERRFQQAVEALGTFVDDSIETRRETVSEAGDDDPDVCAVLLAAHEAGELSLPEVRHNLVAFLLAGHESPSGALTRVWYLLEKHPDVEKKLCEEYERVVSGDRPTAEAYDDLEYTRRVVDETLRLLPPTTGVSRQAIEPVTLAGYDLPAGAQFLIPQWVPHRDERFWDDPETFDPDRWTRDDDDRPAYAYFPFSGGPRRCIGGDFARQELTLALATMIGRVDLEVTAEEPLSFVPSLQLRLESDVTGIVRHSSVSVD